MPIVLDEVALLAAPTLRSRAYAQRLAGLGILPATVIHVPGRTPDTTGLTSGPVQVGGGETMDFDPHRPVEATLADSGIRSLSLPETDIHAPACHQVFAALPQQVIIFSGPSGTLVRPALLGLGKRFLHVHGGYAPHYRGSTAFYYSLLAEGMMGATALWLDQDIDTGPILQRGVYRPPPVDLDRIGDPVIRAHLLGEVMRHRARTGRFPDAQSDHDGATTYHVIHPVLKHLALRRRGMTP